jgi:hypothetical protein
VSAAATRATHPRGVKYKRARQSNFLLSVTLRWAKAAQKRQKVALARLILGWQDVRKMNASKNQFSLTRAAPSTSGRAKNQILINNNSRRFT